MIGRGPLPLDDYELAHWDEASLCVEGARRGFARYRQMTYGCDPLGAGKEGTGQDGGKQHNNSHRKEGKEP